MAYNNSGELPIGQSYQLGDYVFSITVSHDPGESETGINVRCDKGDERARVASEVTGTVESWSVEANETEASVYVTVKKSQYQLINQRLAAEAAEAYCVSLGGHLASIHSAAENAAVRSLATSGGVTTAILLGGTGFGSSKTEGWSWTDGTPWDYQNWNSGEPNSSGHWVQMLSGGKWDDMPDGQIKAGFVCKFPGTQTDSVLVARFAIDIREAGGGPDGDWDEPGDTGNPSYTLNVNVTGASAGTHDAAAVPVAPADQPVYGSGGAGGNGGGGGAGQSTVIVRRFATDKAGSVNQEVTLRPSGVGGKGGPGGRGGDGCILIFY